MYELMINHGGVIQYPVILDDVVWSTERKGQPGKLTFSVLSDGILKINEGDHVSFKQDGKNVFYGFVFKRSWNKDKIISITAYDQLRYLKNKEIYKFENKTATEVIKIIADDFRLQVGTLEDTAYKIEEQEEDNQTLWDIILNALDITLANKKKMYVLYDDFGKLTLKDIETMRVNLLIDEVSGENFNFSSSIDGSTYNHIKVAYDNEATGKREIYITKDSTNINRWGLLQYFETIDEKVNGQAMVNALIELYNKKENNLSLTNVFGDVRVRAGSSVLVQLDLGDFKLQHWMLVERTQHKFKKDEYVMDLSLRGGGLDQSN
jgi:hypothetical protein